jgi:hypothetical protein
MSIATRVNAILAIFGYQVLRSSTVAVLEQARTSAADQSRPRRALEALVPEPPRALADVVAGVLDDVHHRHLDISPALLTALKDIRVTAQISAGQSSATWIARHADRVEAFKTRQKMLDHLCKFPIPDGALAEFGVFTGAITRYLRPRFPDRAYHAFDSFLGVPEAMGLAVDAGDFSLGGQVPELPEGVTVHAGWFEDTLPAFCQTYDCKLAFVYIDCDLYESVRTVLTHLHDRLTPGAIVAFDDWYNFPNWEQHSKRALEDLVDQTGARFSPVAITTREHAIACRYEGRGISP